MTQLPRLDHVNVTVTDLDATIAFFTGLGLELDARMTIEGEFLDTVVGMEDASTETVWLRPPGGGGALEVSRYDLRATVERLLADGHELVGEVGEYEGTWLMAYVRGPEGIIVSLTERIG